MKQVYIGFGSNVGDSLAHLQNVQNRLCSLIPAISLQVSPAYWSEPLLKKGQERSSHDSPYLNAVLGFKTEWDVVSVFHALENLEKQLGRTSGKSEWKPRTVDLDILFYDDMIYEDEFLKVPHSQMCHRKFVLQPLCDLAPDWVHPECGLTIKKLLDLCDDSLKVWLCST